MQQTLDFYKQALNAMRYAVDEEGLISYTSPTGQLVPAEIDGKRMVLPTKAWLKKGFGAEFQAWHPLSETMARRGTSAVMQHMQRNCRAQLGFTYVYLAQQLLRVAADRELHKELPPTDDCNDFLSKMQLADDKLVKTFDRLIQAASEKKRLITLYLKNGGTYRGKKVNRLAVIRFPLIEMLESEEPKVLGIDIKPKQRAVLATLLRTILPIGDGDAEEYSAGSNNRVAPYFHAFAQAYRKVIVQLNKIIARYAVPMALPIKPFPLFDEDYLAKFADIYDEIPSLDGNEGGVNEVDDEEAVPEVAVQKPKGGTKTIEVVNTQPAQGVAPTITVQHAPAPQAAPLRQAAKVVEEDMIDFASLRASLMPQQATYQAPQPTHVVLPWQQQVQAPQAANPFAQVAGMAGRDNQPIAVQNPYGSPYGAQQGMGSTIVNTGYQVGMAAANLV